MNLSETLQRARVQRAYREVFSTPAGRRVLNDLLGFTHFNDDPLVPGMPDATAHTLGKQRVVRRILSFLYRSEADLAKRAMQATTEDDE